MIQGHFHYLYQEVYHKMEVSHSSEIGITWVYSNTDRLLQWKLDWFVSLHRIILDSDATSIVQKVSIRNEDTPLGEHTMSQVINWLSSDYDWRILFSVINIQNHFDPGLEWIGELGWWMAFTGKTTQLFFLERLVLPILKNTWLMIYESVLSELWPMSFC